MDNPKDEKLVARFIKGDKNAFSLLIERYLKQIYNFIYRLVGDPHTAEDLSQEVFLKVWKNISRFDQNRSFKTWLFTIAKNTAYDFLKKKKSLPFSYFEREETRNKIYEMPDNALSPAKVSENSDLARNIEGKLKKIPPYYRTILLLHYKNDFSLIEIANILQKPYNTIKSQHQRALRRFKKLM